jgi:hypothetical protein
MSGISAKFLIFGEKVHCQTHYYGAAKHEIDGLAVLVDRAVEIRPLPRDFHI